MINLQNWEDPTNKKRLEIVFANRNHDYGAYIIRKNYDNLLARSLLITFSIVILLFSAPFISRLFTNNMVEIKKENLKIVEIDLTNVIPENKIERPLEKVNHPSGGAKKQFTTIIVKDTATSVIDSQHDLSKTDFGSKVDTSLLVDYDLPATDTTDATPKLYINSEIMPSFPGGENALLRYLAHHIKYPETANMNKISGTVYINFIVDREGSIINAEVLRGIGGGCDQEALRVIKSMPRWSPGIQNSEPVMVKYLIPVKFSLK